VRAGADVKVTLFMAMSANAMIARPEYKEDFLSRSNWASFLDCARASGAMMWGRKTHEKVRTYGPQYFQQLAGLHNVVVTTRRDFVADEPGFDTATSPSQAIDKLSKYGCQHVTLAGGSILNSAAAVAQLIDEVMLNIEAVIVGRGIRLFAPADFDLKLRLEKVRQLDDQIVQLGYAVLRP
jgi:dihydrofolate reductase